MLPKHGEPLFLSGEVLARKPQTREIAPGLYEVTYRFEFGQQPDCYRERLENGDCEE